MRLGHARAQRAAATARGQCWRRASAALQTPAAIAVASCTRPPRPCRRDPDRFDDDQRPRPRRPQILVGGPVGDDDLMFAAAQSRSRRPRLHAAHQLTRGCAARRLRASSGDSSCGRNDVWCSDRHRNLLAFAASRPARGLRGIPADHGMKNSRVRVSGNVSPTPLRCADRLCARARKDCAPPQFAL